MSAGLFRFFSLGILLVALSGCATQAANQGEAVLPSLKAQISSLERTEAQLRSQHAAMGRTLEQLSDRIADLKIRAATPSTSVKPAIAPTTTPPASPAITGPTTLVPVTPAQAPSRPQVSRLTPTDLDIEKTDTITAANASRQVYVVHLASYMQSAQVRTGWSELKQQHATSLAGLRPYVTTYKDAQERNWLRLSAGPLGSRQEAEKRIQALKAEGTWCEVLQVPVQSMRTLN